MSMPAADQKQQYIGFNATWRGVGLTIRHCADWCAMVGMDHIEVVSADRAPLPITETGYKSHFISAEQIADVGTPVEFVLAWLDHAAQSQDWKHSEAEARQLSLF